MHRQPRADDHADRTRVNHVTRVPIGTNTMATSARLAVARPAAPSARHALAAPALLAAPLFLITAALLTSTNLSVLRAWGWYAYLTGVLVWILIIAIRRQPAAPRKPAAG